MNFIEVNRLRGQRNLFGWAGPAFGGLAPQQDRTNPSPESFVGSHIKERGPAKTRLEATIPLPFLRLSTKPRFLGKARRRKGFMWPDSSRASVRAAIAAPSGSVRRWRGSPGRNSSDLLSALAPSVHTRGDSNCKPQRRHAWMLSNKVAAPDTTEDWDR